LVYLKDEGSKFQPRESYIIVNERGSELLLQKISTSGFLSSKQYWVPKNKVFPVNNMLKEKKAIAATCPSDSDTSISDSDCVVETEPAVVVDADVPSAPSRPVRQRRRPDYYGTVQNPDIVDTPSNDDMIDNWYPGWDQERTRRYIANGHQEFQ